MKLAIVAILSLFSLTAVASGPREITTYEVRTSNTEQVSVCFKDYGGWGESQFKCTTPVESSRLELLAALHLLKAKPAARIDDFRAEIPVSTLLLSLVNKNCLYDVRTETPRQDAEALRQEIYQRIEAINYSSSNPLCD